MAVTESRPSHWHRYLAWRRGRRWHLSPNGFIVLLLIALAVAPVVAFLGPSGDGAGPAFWRGIAVGAVVAVAARLLARREQRRARGSS